MEGMGPMLPEGAKDAPASPVARSCLDSNSPCTSVEADFRSRRLAVRNTFIHVEDDQESDIAEHTRSLFSWTTKSAPSSPTYALIHPLVSEDTHLDVTRADDSSPDKAASGPLASPSPTAWSSPAASQTRRLAVRNTFIHVEDEDDEHGELSLFTRLAQSAPSSPTKAMAVQARDVADDVYDLTVCVQSWSGTPSSSSSFSMLTDAIPRDWPVSKERRAGKEIVKAEVEDKYWSSTPRSCRTRLPFASSSPCRQSEIDLVAESTACSPSGRSDLVDLSRLSLSSFSSTSPGSPSRRTTVRSTISHVEEEEHREDELDSSGFSHELNGLPSIGSASHGAGWCKPCAFVLKQEGCRLSFQCSFCHLCGPGAKRRRQRQKKEMIQARTLARRLQREAALASKDSNARGKNTALTTKGVDVSHAQ